MRRVISDMLESYERGRINRRQLVKAVAMLATAAHSHASRFPFQGSNINHVALNVTDLDRSRDFYQDLLGMPVVRESRNSCFLGLGKNFLALFRNDQPSMNHYCIGIENYDVDTVTTRLKTLGLNPDQTVGSNRVYFRDPDDLMVQLSSADHQP